MDGAEETTSPLNYNTYRDVEENIAAGMPEVMLDLIDTYLIDSRRQLQMLSDAVETEAYEQIKRSAHTLKSTSATFGAEELAALFARIEQQARRQDAARLVVLLAQAREQFETVVRVLHVEQERLRCDR